MNRAIADGFSQDEFDRIWIRRFFDIANFWHCLISACLPLSLFRAWEHYNQFADEAQWRKVTLNFSLQKRLKTAGPFCAQELLPKDSAGNILRPLTCPLTDKVSQAEMEAGDCEGRLPPLFYGAGLRSCLA